MKKLAFALSVVALTAFATTSCKKDYTCTCTDGTESMEYPYSKQKKKDAEDMCDKQQEQFHSIGGTDVTCSLD